MRTSRFVFCLLLALGVGGPAKAVEGPAAAGPIGGTDIRQAIAPPPGLYVGGAFVGARTTRFVGPKDRQIPGLEDAQLGKVIGGPFALYVPDVTLWGGAIGLGGVLPFVHQCGRLFSGTSRECRSGMGDPYFEVDWARYFGTPRASKHPNAYPIAEGLAVLLGLGVVVPIGDYSARDPLRQSLSAGTNVWDVAPSVAVTYTTAPIIAEGTEFSAKLFWNNYFANRKTDYRTGDLLNLDFAVTEHVGPMQIGLTGFYARQVEDDTIRGAAVPPNGRRGELLQLGGVAAYDLPALASSVKVKALTSAYAQNTVRSWAFVAAWVTRR